MTTLMPAVHLVAGARPNFMKTAPLVRALRADGRLRSKLVHTGQHFDHDMSGVFFDELGIPAPDVHFNCGGGSHATQRARGMEAFEQHCGQDRPDAVVVVGDVNSTLACALVAQKAGITLAHVAAGLRSGDPLDARGDQPHRHRLDHRLVLRHRALGPRQPVPQRAQRS